MKANFGLLAPPTHRLHKQERYRYYAERAAKAMTGLIRDAGITPLAPTAQ
jgi:folate-dependent tRNA-U54 methylase TrmFO/GidA